MNTQIYNGNMLSFKKYIFFQREYLRLFAKKKVYNL